MYEDDCCVVVCVDALLMENCRVVGGGLVRGSLQRWHEKIFCIGVSSLPCHPFPNEETVTKDYIALKQDRQNLYIGTLDEQDSRRNS